MGFSPLVPPSPCPQSPIPNPQSPIPITPYPQRGPRVPQSLTPRKPR
ncbi:hypothetical protein FDUTEX481_02447 [Tolypothrix sp. PCC 7601]|nr:hypothetical protein FDUTEX481_02447 [Tolypothrix sp. PCC 7601]